MATKTLAMIKKAREDDFERKVQSQMKIDQRGLWEIICRKPKQFLSHDQAYKLLSATVDDEWALDNEYERSHRKYSEQYNKVKRLLTLAQNAYDDFIYVTADDMWFITE